MILFLAITGSALFTLFMGFLALMYWDDTRSTKSSDAYLNWYRHDLARRTAVEEAWRDGNNY